MSSQIYNTCVQYTFIFFQMFLGILGVIMISIGAWLETGQNGLEVLERDSLPGLLVVIGCVIMIVVLFGILGTVCKKKIVNKYLLMIYLFQVFPAFLLQQQTGFSAFVYREQLSDFIAINLNQSLERYGGMSAKDQAVTISWDFIQESVPCCGINGVEDWFSLNDSFSDLFEGGDFPSSCCVATAPICNLNSTALATDVHSEGCSTALSRSIRSNLLIIASIGIAFVMGEIVVMLIAVCLLCDTLDFSNDDDDD